MSGLDSSRRQVVVPACDCAPAESSVRCACGSLLARYVGGQVELKCRRCKRTVLIAIEPALDGA